MMIVPCIFLLVKLSLQLLLSPGGEGACGGPNSVRNPDWKYWTCPEALICRVVWGFGTACKVMLGTWRVSVAYHEAAVVLFSGGGNKYREVYGCAGAGPLPQLPP